MIGKLVIAGACVAGAVISEPLWYSPVVHAVPQLGLVLPPPKQAPSPGTSPPMFSVNRDPVRVQAPTPHPVSSPAPTPVGPPAIAAADCAWAQATLDADARLDTAEAQAIASGQDTRYPGDATLYTGYAQQWTQIGAWIAAACNGQPFTAEQVAQADAWMSDAISAHQADSANNPNDAAWDDVWIAAYTRIESIFTLNGYTQG